MTEQYELPWHKEDYVILSPKDILTKDETWINKPGLLKDFKEVVRSISDCELRAQVNDYFKRILQRKPSSRQVAEAKRKVIAKYQELIFIFYIRKTMGIRR